jgi:pyruvate/2-oxoglutarate dehydrogenase complex dihydrolipoamide acyltransferase (E2) component
MSNVELITKIAVTPDLWAASVLPQALIERWLLPDGTVVEAGDPVANISVEDALHEIMAPARGRLSIELKANSVVEPGTTIGRVICQVPTAPVGDDS